VHPEVRPASYRRARGLHNYDEWEIKKQRYSLLSYRLDLETETLQTSKRATWTKEEVLASLDYVPELQKEVDQYYEARLGAIGGFGKDTTRGIRGIQRQMDDYDQAQGVKYRFYMSLEE